MPLVVDRLRPEDLPGALRLSTQAGWNQLAQDWQRLLDLSPDGCFAGRLDGALVATATAASYGRDAHWIGMVLVDETMRGRGFGATMLQHTIEFARSRGGGVVGLDATDLGRPVYLKQGFVDVTPIDRWSGVLKPTQDVGDVGLLERSGFDQVLSFDQTACGLDRSELIRHLMHETKVVGAVAFGNSITGYAFVRPGRTAWHLGPVVAREGHDFMALLSRLSTITRDSLVLADAIRTPGTSSILEQSGLSIARRLTRMTLNASSKTLMGDAVRAAMSFEWG